jgi:hypothetical protein
LQLRSGHNEGPKTYEKQELHAESIEPKELGGLERAELPSSELESSVHELPVNEMASQSMIQIALAKRKTVKPKLLLSVKVDKMLGKEPSPTHTERGHAGGSHGAL